MEEKIESHLASLNFLEICNYVDKEENETQLDQLAKCICQNNISTTVNILEKCSCRNVDISKLNKNILDELENELVKKRNDETFVCIKQYVFLLYRVMLFFDKINLETIKMVYDIFLIFSLRLVIFLNEKEFLLRIVMSILRNLKEKKKKKNKNNKLYDSFMCLLEKTMYEMYCFIHMSHFIYLHSLLIYLYANVHADRYRGVRRDTMQTISDVLIQINTILKKLHELPIHENITIEDINNHWNSCPPILRRGDKNTFFRKPFEGECLIDTVNKTTIKLIYEECHFPQLSYSIISTTFDTNKYALSKKKYLQNYNTTNVNINNFLLLLKIMSPNFLLWVSNKKTKTNWGQNVQRGITSNEQNDLYTFNLYYVLEDSRNHNYLKDSMDTFIFLYFLLHSLHNVNKNMDSPTKILIKCVLENYVTLFRKSNLSSSKKENIWLSNPSEGKTEMDVLYHKREEELSNLEVCIGGISKNGQYLEEAKGGKKIKEMKNNTREENFSKDRSYTMLDTIPFTTSHIFRRNTEKMVAKLKSLIIWGYVHPDNSDELNFFKLSNVFIFNENLFSGYKKRESISQYLFRKNNFFIYNYALFKNTYECKTLGYKYMDRFSDFISRLLLHFILVLTKFYMHTAGLFQDSTIEDMCQKELTGVYSQSKNAPEKYASAHKENETNDKNEKKLQKGDTKMNSKMDLKKEQCTEKRENKNKISNNTIELDKNISEIFTSTFCLEIYPIDENIEPFFNDLLFICFKLINYPCKEVQNICLCIISIIVPRINGNSCYMKYINKKAETLINFIDDEIFDQNEVLRNYIYIKIKLGKKLNFDIVDSVKELIRICSLKLHNKKLCSLICKNVLLSFYYYPCLLPFVLHKYISLIFYLIETNNITTILDALKCLLLLFKINLEDIKIYCDDIVYRLHLLFNIFREDKPNISTNDIARSENSSHGSDSTDASKDVTSFLKKFYFNATQVEQGRLEILRHIKLILYCVHSACSAKEYAHLMRIFNVRPREYKEHAQKFRFFSLF
ncbi:hypothetical protein, conserved [Plasmodium ovale curtisi]|uniref:Uncharacterized protein n=1 Tax=Plasmodium ovale curtisi TaxID=864141 RepID=A0A1A8W8J6_PLAOA|nr:hypothetical protein, conserved [Plasmodium ovale curtisi]